MYMKVIRIFLVLCFPFFLLSCGSAEEEAPAQNYMDSLYTEKGFRHTLDSIKAHGQMEAADLKGLRKFIIKYRDKIPETMTFANIRDAAKKAEAAYDGSISLNANNLWMRKEGKMIEFRFELSAHNRTPHTLSHFRGELVWLDNDGSTIWRSPRFSVVEN